MTVGHNSYAPLTGFNAGPGYDLVTGVGAPIMSNLHPALVAQP